MRQLHTVPLLAALVCAVAASHDKWTRIDWSAEQPNVYDSVMLEAHGTGDAYAYTFDGPPTGEGPIKQWDLSNGSNPSLQRSIDPQFNAAALPVVVNGTLFAMNNNVLEAYPNTTWNGGYPPPGPTWTSSPLPCNATSMTYGAGRLYVGCPSGYVFALNPATNGTIEWAANAPVNATVSQQLLFVANVAGDSVIVNQHAVTALDASTGAQRWAVLHTEWEHDVVCPVAASPDGAQVYMLAKVRDAPNWNTVFFTADVVSVSTLTGDVVWNTTFAPYSASGPQMYAQLQLQVVATVSGAIASFSMISGETNIGVNTVVAFDAGYGRQMWNVSYPTYTSDMNQAYGRPVLSQPTVVNDHTEVVVCQTFNCSGIATASGVLQPWRFGITVEQGETLSEVRTVGAGRPNQFMVRKWMSEGEYDQYYAWIMVDITLPAHTPAPANFAVIQRCPGATTCVGAQCALTTTILGCNGNGTKHTCGPNGGSLTIEYFSNSACSGYPSDTKLLLKDVCTVGSSAATELISC